MIDQIYKWTEAEGAMSTERRTVTIVIPDTNQIVVMTSEQYQRLCERIRKWQTAIECAEYHEDTKTFALSALP
jgi:hypothetical protein